MAREKNGVFRILRVKKDDDLKTIYAKAHRAFTAADLQRYTQDEEMLPAEQLLKDMKEMLRQAETKKQSRKRAKRARHGKE